MKKLATALCVVCISYAQAQKISAEKVPANVINSFKKQFSNPTKPVWEMDEKNFEVNFKSNSVEHSVKYSAEGNWLETEQEIKTSELPAAVKQAVEKEFPKAEIEESEKVSLPDNLVVYELEIETNKQKFEIRFSTDGKLLKKEEMRKKENKD